MKGTAEIDWGDAEQRRRFRRDRGRRRSAARADADRAERAGGWGARPRPPWWRRRGLLSRVLVQDIERREDGPAIKEGVAKDRLLSVHDPEMRHGRKSASKRFDGHKAALAVDTDEPLIVAIDVLAGNARSAEALELVEQAEAIWL